MKKTIIERNSSAAKKNTITGAVMSALSIALIALGLHNGSLIYAAIGVIGAVYFIFVTVYALLFSYNDKPVLVIEEKGIYNYSTAVAPGYIDFADIEGFHVSKIMRDSIIGIDFKDNDKFIDSLKGRYKRAAIYNQKYKYPLSYISFAQVKDRDIGEIINMLNDSLKLARRENIFK